MGGFLLRKKSEKCIAFSRPEFALQTRAFQGYVRTSCYLHSFATLRNWLRQPLQSLPRFKIKKTELNLLNRGFYYGKKISNKRNCCLWNGFAAE